MARGRRLKKFAAILFAAAGMTIAAVPHASAATGAGGLTILYASSDDQAHQCNVIGQDSAYQAVICSDIVTYEGATDYYAYGRTELICQTRSTPHTVAPCSELAVADTLEAGDGTSTGLYANAVLCEGNCPDGRYYYATRNWVYKISDAEGGRCSSSAGTSYALWNVVWGDSTKIWLPDETPNGGNGYLVQNGNPNDYPNESSGHYFICP